MDLNLSTSQASLSSDRAGYRGIKMCQFTLFGGDDRWIYINPLHVVSVVPHDDHTQITTVPTGIFSKKPVFKVKETADIVLRRLTQ